MSQQGLRQQSFRTHHGVAGNHPYEADLMLAFAVAPESITTGTFNERLLAWINARTSAAHTNVNAACQAYAAAKGAGNWSSLGTHTP